MEEVRTEDILIRDVETKNIMTKSNLPVGGYSRIRMSDARTPASIVTLLS